MALPNFDLPSFQSEVLQEARNLKNIASLGDYVRWAREERLNLVNKSGKGLQWVAFFVLFLLSEKLCALLARILVRGKDLGYYTGAAEDLLSQRAVKQRLCSALESSENDLFKVATVITPILVTEAETKNISLPLDPLLFGVCAQTITRTGINKYCDESISNGEVDPG